MRSQSSAKSGLFGRMALLQLKGRSWWLPLLLWLGTLAPVQAALDLRVAIEEGRSQIKVGSSTKATVRDGAGNALGEVQAMNAFVAEPKNGKIALDQWQAGMIWVEPTNGGYVWIGDRWYRGRALVVPTGKGLTAVNYVDLEHYLYSVLGGEMSCNWPLEALKAQAVAARSYALHQRAKSANTVFDVGDTTSWQVYDGIEDECNTTQAAVEQTAGQVLIYQNQIIEAVFHSASGGHTENVEDIWVQALPYLRGVPDFDQGTPGFQWEKTLSRAELSRLISGVGDVISFTPERQTRNGRIIRMKVVGDRGTRTLTGENLRSALGLRSTLFQVFPQYRAASAGGAAKQNRNPLPDSFRIVGRGFGHGLGMSQWGAYNMALKGSSYDQILKHYYQQAELARIEVR